MDIVICISHLCCMVCYYTFAFVGGVSGIRFLDILILEGLLCEMCCNSLMFGIYYLFVECSVANLKRKFAIEFSFMVFI